VKATRLDGMLLIVSTRLNCNLRDETIEEMQYRMKKVHEQLVEIVEEDCHAQGVQRFEGAMNALMQHKERITTMAPTDFNKASHYLRVTQAALDCKLRAFAEVIKGWCVEQKKKLLYSPVEQKWSSTKGLMSPKDTDTGYTGSPSKARSTMMQVLTATYKEEMPKASKLTHHDSTETAKIAVAALLDKSDRNALGHGIPLILGLSEKHSEFGYPALLKQHWCQRPFEEACRSGTGVSHLDLFNRKLTCKLPPSFITKFLPKVDFFNLGGNHFEGIDCDTLAGHLVYNMTSWKGRALHRLVLSKSDVTEAKVINWLCERRKVSDVIPALAGVMELQELEAKHGDESVEIEEEEGQERGKEEAVVLNELFIHRPLNVKHCLLSKEVDLSARVAIHSADTMDPMDHEDTALAVALLRRNSQLRVLKLGNNRITSLGARYLGDLFQRGGSGRSLEGPAIEMLDLSKNNIGISMERKRASSVSSPPPLAETLLEEEPATVDDGDEDLDAGDDGCPGLVHLAGMIQHSTSLTHLNLSSNGIGAHESMPMTRALAHSRVLRHLDVSDNLMQGVGVAYLLDALVGDRGGVLHDGYIHSEHKRAIQSPTRNNTSYENLTDTLTHSAADGRRPRPHHSPIECLNVSGNRIAQYKRVESHSGLDEEHWKSAKDNCLPHWKKRVSTAGAGRVSTAGIGSGLGTGLVHIDWAQTLASNQRVQEVDLSMNHFDVSTAHTLAEVLTLSGIRTLHFSGRYRKKANKHSHSQWTWDAATTIRADTDTTIAMQASADGSKDYNLGVILLSAMLPKCSALTALDLRRTDLSGDAAVQSLVTALESCLGVAHKNIEEKDACSSVMAAAEVVDDDDNVDYLMTCELTTLSVLQLKKRGAAMGITASMIKAAGGHSGSDSDWIAAIETEERQQGGKRKTRQNMRLQRQATLNAQHEGGVAAAKAELSPVEARRVPIVLLDIRDTGITDVGKKQLADVILRSCQNRTAKAEARDEGDSVASSVTSASRSNSHSNSRSNSRSTTETDPGSSPTLRYLYCDGFSLGANTKSIGYRAGQQVLSGDCTLLASLLANPLSAVESVNLLGASLADTDAEHLLQVLGWKTRPAEVAGEHSDDGGGIKTRVRTLCGLGTRDDDDADDADNESRAIFQGAGYRGNLHAGGEAQKTSGGMSGDHATLDLSQHAASASVSGGSGGTQRSGGLSSGSMVLLLHELHRFHKSPSTHESLVDAIIFKHVASKSYGLHLNSNGENECENLRGMLDDRHSVLFAFLPRCTRLARLDISSNSIGADGALALASYLGCHAGRGLLHLDISHCNVSELGRWDPLDDFLGRHVQVGGAGGGAGAAAAKIPSRWYRGTTFKPSSGTDKYDARSVEVVAQQRRGKPGEKLMMVRTIRTRGLQALCQALQLNDSLISLAFSGDWDASNGGDDATMPLILGGVSGGSSDGVQEILQRESHRVVMQYTDTAFDCAGKVLGVSGARIFGAFLHRCPSLGSITFGGTYVDSTRHLEMESHHPSTQHHHQHHSEGGGPQCRSPHSKGWRQGEGGSGHGQSSGVAGGGTTGPKLVNVASLRVSDTVARLSGKRLGLAGIAMACAFLARCSATDIQLGNNELGVGGAALVARMLMEGAALTRSTVTCRHRVQRLDISENQIEAAGAAYLAQALVEEGGEGAGNRGRNRCGLKHLVANNNNIGGFYQKTEQNVRWTVRGPQELAGALRSNKTLEYLDISQNFLGDVGAECFVKVLSKEGKSCALEQLDISGNEVHSAASRNLLANALEKGGLVCN
jgi:Ran GTPase-activating protein (RanGAP) involved in mRNA processing and transport